MIQAEEISKRFGTTTALNAVSLHVKRGALFGLLGPNGAGKSTLINVITGLLKQDGGTVRFGELSGGPREIKRALGLVPQDLAFYLNYSATENVRFFASLYGLKGRELSAATEEALVFAGLEDAGRKPAKTYSGGMKRRLNIACGIAHRPEVIIFDEPTVGIDPQSRNHILRSVENLARGGKTVIYTTHYMEEAEAICGEIAIMDKGKVIAQGSPERLKLLVKDRSRLRFRLKRQEAVDLASFERIGGVAEAELDELELSITSDVGIDNVNELMAEVNRQRLIVSEVSSESPSLETVFLNLTGRSLRD